MKDKVLDKGIRRAKRLKRKWLNNEIKLLKLCFKHMMRIGYPTNKDDQDKLCALIELYDKHIALIEKDFVGMCRGYIR